MAIKKRERVLTPEEFKAKQKRDYTPFWINSEVLFGGNLYPVEDEFSKQTTILFLLDPVDFTTERVMDLMSHWKTKYSKLPWEPVLVFQQKYIFMKNPKFYERFKNQKIFLDTFGELFERFGSKNESVAVILKNGEFISSFPLNSNFSETTFIMEQQFQSILRTVDAGLPLPNPEKWTRKNSAMTQNTITSDSVSTFGEWSSSNNLLITDKNNSMIAMPFKGKYLRLAAMPHPEARENIKVGITLNEKSIPAAIRCPIIHDDNTGMTFFELTKNTGIYDLIQSDKEVSGIIKITFLNAYDNGAVFYEFKTAS